MKDSFAGGALIAILAVACSREPPRPRHVVLITVDTLRADHLGLYGYPRPTSPFMDSLAAESTLFVHAGATAPSTSPSMAKLLTGVHRSSHGVRANGENLPEGVETLAEILKAHGFRTIARIANPLLDRSHGFAQGFDDFAMPVRLEGQLRALGYVN
jgi:arylsulfatase A-like enzyme